MQLFARRPFTAAGISGGQFPENTTWFQRMDASVIYTFDKEPSRGWDGRVT